MRTTPSWLARAFVLCGATIAQWVPWTAEAACRLEDAGLRHGGIWHAKVHIDETGWQLVGVIVRERGRDVILQVGANGRSAASDVAPSRYATERALMLVHGPTVISAQAHGYAEPIDSTLDATVVCIQPIDPRFWPLAYWQTLTALVAESDNTTLPGDRTAFRLRALDFAERFQNYARANKVDAALVAGALHVQGYLLARIGQHSAARDRLDEASAAWRNADDAAAAAAAHFDSAKETLALGDTDAALKMLQPLLEDRVQRAYPGIAAWAKNDRCLVLRDTNRRDDAAACFADLVVQLDAIGERKEAANALCNWGVTLGSAGRWTQAQERIRQCAERRATLGMPAGIAHAELLLGWISLEAGTVDQAVAHLERSLEHAERAGSAGAAWDAQRWLAQAWLDADELPRAREAIRRIEPDDTQDSARKAQWHSALARLALYADDTATATTHFDQALRRFSSTGQEAAAVNVRCETALIDVSQPISPDCDPLTRAQAYRRRGAFELSAEQLHKPEIGAGREIFRRFLLQIDDRRNPSAVGSIVAQAQALPQHSPATRALRGQLLARMAFELAALAERNDSEELARLAIECATKSANSAAYTGSRLTTAPQPVDPLPVRASLQSTPITAGTVVVGSASQLGVTYLIIARRTGTRIVRASSADIAAAARHWRDAIEHEQSAFDEAMAMSALLRVDEWWLDVDRRVVLAMHGPLSTIPWSALPIRGEPLSVGYRPLVDQASVVQLAGTAPYSQRPADTLRIAFFPTESDPDLPGTAVERDAIVGLARKAGWTRIAGETAIGGIVHIASHATSDTVDARRNTLLVSRRSQYSPLPYPTELVRGARLVVLAGCETGLGPMSRWTSATSLARVALDDGAASTLAHLWPIADAAAARLHVAFYRAFFEGHREDEALAAAQRELLREPVGRIPARWASPVLLIRGDAMPEF